MDYDRTDLYTSFFMRTKSVETPAIQVCDWVKVVLNSGTYELRVKEKIMKDGVMRLTLIDDPDGWQ